MTVLWMLFVGSVIVLPGTAVLALRWAMRHGEFEHLEKTALSIFDDEEPVGVMTDHFPDTLSRETPGTIAGFPTMNASAPSILKALSPADVEDVAQRRAALAEIDASCRNTLLLLFGASLVWLLLGTVLALVASWKLHSPEFLGDIAWLTFGRVRPAHLNAVVFGFASEAAIGVTLWLMCRLCRTPLMFGWIVNLAGVFWNLGVAVGMVGILAGDSTGIEWLEIPAYATPLLFVTYALIGMWGIITFRFRRERHLYVSQWYLLAALFWFPWLYSAAQILLVMEPVRGTVQAAVNWWFAHNVLGLWFTPIGLAAIYYFIPKVIGRPVYNYSLSVLGFWSLALFYNWNGMHHLVGGPLPAWLITVSIVASVMMTIPVVTVGINHHMTMWGSFHKLKDSPVLRFMVFGGMSYTVTSLHGVLLALSLGERGHALHPLDHRPRAPGDVRLFHHDHVRRHLLHHAARAPGGMALGAAHPHPFLGHRHRHHALRGAADHGRGPAGLGHDQSGRALPRPGQTQRGDADPALSQDALLLRFCLRSGTPRLPSVSSGSWRAGSRRCACLNSPHPHSL